ncbi:uncharacterized protein OCT59_008687 [Rhizophagus irregularis]|uniref:uncharacterized protein n=1 Tax=Rhizophagus irregularis TaxID=588596 RepID=UPI00332B3FF5|nr:hypothetical protein OCT59_008687 [Rhizophagus irregularis]
MIIDLVSKYGKSCGVDRSNYEIQFTSIFSRLKRQDALSGFKSCKDNFPNCEATIHIAGKATVTIENGALYKITGFDENIQIFHHEISFCEAIVTLSGFSCPNTDNKSCIEGNIKISYP